LEFLSAGKRGEESYVVEEPRGLGKEEKENQVWEYKPVCSYNILGKKIRRTLPGRLSRNVRLRFQQGKKKERLVLADPKEEKKKKDLVES